MILDDSGAPNVVNANAAHHERLEFEPMKNLDDIASEISCQGFSLKLDSVI